MATATISSKGQIVLPKQLREEMELREGDRVEVGREGDRIVLRPVGPHRGDADWRSWRGTLSGSEALADHLREHREEVSAERLP